jgi:EF hand
MRTKVVMLLGLAILLADCGTALTQEGPGGKGGRRGGRTGSNQGPAEGPGGRAQSFDDMAEAQFKRRDKNGDGFLNTDEMPVRLRAQLHRWDTNRDGLIDLQEFKAYLRDEMRDNEMQDKRAADEAAFIRGRAEKVLLDTKSSPAAYSQAISILSGLPDGYTAFAKGVLFWKDKKAPHEERSNRQPRSDDWLYKACMDRLSANYQVRWADKLTTVAKSVPVPVLAEFIASCKNNANYIDFLGMAGWRAKIALPTLKEIEDGPDLEMASHAFRAIRAIEADLQSLPGSESWKAKVEAARSKSIALHKALLEEAQKVYETNEKQFSQGVQGLDAQSVYLWSRRWLEAQLDVVSEMGGNAAESRVPLTEHLDRMKELERKTAALASTGQGRQADASAARYFRIQAELWVEFRPRPKVGVP